MPDTPQAIQPQPSARDPLDRLLDMADNALRTLSAPRAHAARPTPAAGTSEAVLGDEQRGTSASLMRINHAGEVAAQGLYQGHMLVARDADLESTLRHAADEEFDHLAWCRQRLEELGAKPSVLDPIWYAGAFAIGAASGMAGDRWGLGFIAETERQVVEHLSDHLQKLPDDDARSLAILSQMRDEEAEHGEHATEAGAKPLPEPVKALMKLAARVMKAGASRI